MCAKTYCSAGWTWALHCMDDSKICRGILWVYLWMFMLTMLTKALWINTETHCRIQISSLCLLVVFLKQASCSWVLSVGGHSAFGSWVAKLRLPSSVSVHKWCGAALFWMFRRGRPRGAMKDSTGFHEKVWVLLWLLRRGRSACV